MASTFPTNLRKRKTILGTELFVDPAAAANFINKQFVPERNERILFQDQIASTTWLTSRNRYVVTVTKERTLMTHSIVNVLYWY